MAARRTWKEFYFMDSSDYRELESAWHHGAQMFPGKEMVFSGRAVVSTNLSLRELALLRRTTLMRNPWPDYVTLDGDPRWATEEQCEAGGCAFCLTDEEWARRNRAGLLR